MEARVRRNKNKEAMNGNLYFKDEKCFSSSSRVNNDEHLRLLTIIIFVFCLKGQPLPVPLPRFEALKMKQIRLK